MCNCPSFCSDEKIIQFIFTHQVDYQFQVSGWWKEHVCEGSNFETKPRKLPQYNDHFKPDIIDQYNVYSYTYATTDASAIVC